MNKNSPSHIGFDQPKQLLNLLAMLLLAASLTACGFHLRGNIPLPENIQNMQIRAPEGTFKDELEDILVNAGANIVADRRSADVVLRVLKAESERDVGTLNERGLANSYDLTFTVRYELVGRGGTIVKEETRVKEQRRYDFDPTLVIETESEERALQEDMEQDVALKIVRQLSRATNYAEDADGEIPEVEDAEEEPEGEGSEGEGSEEQESEASAE
ncbi:MAG: LPS assembly lipoprotein LptE [Pseudomonadota bacterium]